LTAAFARDGLAVATLNAPALIENEGTGEVKKGMRDEG